MNPVAENGITIATPEISVVVPVYRCECTLVELQTRLTAVLEAMALTYEVIYVDDCGPDASWSVLERLAAQDHRVYVIRLSRNYGQHVAITAGLQEASGRWAVVMDCDLQDPPEVIERLYQKSREGYDIVFAKRKKKRHAWHRRLLSKLYSQLLNTFAKTNINPEYGSLSIISRKVINAFLQFSDRNRHYLFILYWLGFTHTDIEYTHAERGDDASSSYSLKHLMKHAIGGVFFQTTILLHWIIYGGFALAMLGFALMLYCIDRYFHFSVLPGWTSIIVLILLTQGVVLICMGVIGLYISQIFEEVLDRPLFVVTRRIRQGIVYD